MIILDLSKEDLDKIVIMIKGSPLYPEDIKEKVLNNLRRQWNKEQKYQEPSKVLEPCGMNRK